MIASRETYMRMKPRRLLVARSEIVGRIRLKRWNARTAREVIGDVQILESALARIEDVWKVRNLEQAKLLPFPKPQESQP